LEEISAVLGRLTMKRKEKWKGVCQSKCTKSKEEIFLGKVGWVGSFDVAEGDM